MQFRILPAAALAAGILSSAVPAIGADPIVIGVVLSEAPAAAALPASFIRAGIEAAAQVANGEEAGKALPVRIVFADDRGTQAGSAEVAARLLGEFKAAALIGGQGSQTAPPQIAAAARAGRPFVNVNGWDAALRLSGVADVFHISPDNTSLAEALARSAAALGAERVAIAAPAADRGAEARAEPLKAALAALEPPIASSFLSLDVPALKPPALAALRRDVPDLVVAIQGGTAGARFLGQMRQAGIAPTARRLVLDGAGIVDSAVFWDDAREAGQYLLSIALHNPAIPLTARGQAVRSALPTDMPETRLFHQGADAVFALVDALRRAQSAEGTALVKALDTAPAIGTRGPIRFQVEKGPRHRQRIDIPFALIQQAEQGAPAARAQVVWVPGRALDTARLARPASAAVPPAAPARPAPTPAPVPPPKPAGAVR
ncbi:ABC-type branched-subunit amino acid transport system substrate-binding protein [Stella humosa]|uniref:ABC-type branched-subunit amino acid transport system substrate-binding protein n=1 Tax=Stella humosa TaxID=94 RepID=A0A3N1KWK3_9PROT|nr:ABC transporter substrate-binding protein [Stella humosa]ROP83822.1 ABC-type branched-subunit amino acid transport system substrate-binding protein [Stella humosa]BBK32917.1 hypothetical protein STHU_35510 [Stella humosa]